MLRDGSRRFTRLHAYIDLLYVHTHTPSSPLLALLWLRLLLTDTDPFWLAVPVSHLPAFARAL